MKTLVVAPHPDDEVLGPGGTLLRTKSEGNSTAWLIVTEMTKGYSKEQSSQRDKEIKEISKLFSFDKVYQAKFPTAELDTIPIKDLINEINKTIKDFTPDEILVPHPGDIHSDHQIVHNAILSCTKWFRYPFIKRILAYETLSETNFDSDPNRAFIPNVFIDITDFLDKKVAAMEIYSSEIGEFPFPRSEVAIKSLARYRGSSSGFLAAESFSLLFSRI